MAWQEHAATDLRLLGNAELIVEFSAAIDNLLQDGSARHRARMTPWRASESRDYIGRDDGGQPPFSALGHGGSLAVGVR